MTDGILDSTKRLYKQEGRAGIFQITIPYIAMGKGMRQYIPATCGESWGLFKNDHGIGVFYEENFAHMAETALQITGGTFPKKWEEKFARIDEELTNASRQLASADMASFTLTELKTVYGTLYALDEAMWNISIFVDSFDTGTDRREMEKVAEKHGLSADEVAVLVTPLLPSFVTEWEMALMAFKRGTKNFDDLKRQFFWIATDYADFGELTHEFAELAFVHANQNLFVSQAAEEKRILTIHHLTQNPLAFFRTITQWRDERKRLNYTGAYGLIKILRETLHRQNMDPNLASVILPRETEALFSEKLKEADLTNRHHDGVFFRVTPEETFEYIFEKSEVERLWNFVRAALGAGISTDELTGMAASRGKTTGRVRVVVLHNDANAHEFQKGDILVTSMTRPEFLPLMKIAGAVVTDEGGITSHAAILSRELGIPCVIGTRVATKVLKNGDMVEVDAERGIVTILKRRPEGT